MILIDSRVDLEWTFPPKPPDLGKKDVHLWRSRLDPPNPKLALLESFLSRDEVARASGYRFEEDRRRFVAGRGLLRQLLGRYLDIHPETLRFSQNPHGKPFPDPKRAGFPLAFNLSHSEHLAVYAISRSRRVGVDLEKIRSIPEAEAIAETYFHPDETAFLQTRSKDNREKRFFEIWTRKEAFLKALGKGLGGLESTCLPPLIPQDEDMEGPAPAQRPEWTVLGLCPEPGFAGALVVEGGECAISGFSL